MKTILQLSDFHIKESMPPPQENPVITSFVQLIKRLQIERPILVYNGDVIDSRAIVDKISYLSLDAEKEKAWDEYAKKTFGLAKEYFMFLKQELGIPNDRIIICCGNHDVNKFAEGTTGFSCYDPNKKNITYGEQRFTLVKDFIDSLVLKQETYCTHFRQIDGINFIVANSNWISKEKGKLCVACDSLNKLISEKEKTLSDTIQKKNKQHNIFVAHAPRIDFCEYALFPYPENNHSSVMDKVDQLCGIELFGDKHTGSVHNYDYIVGAPLDSDYITFGLHQFNDQDQYSHRTLLYINGGWQVSGDLIDIEKIINISRLSFKKKALKYLYGNENVPDLNDLVKNFEKTRSTGAWMQLDQLFRSYITLQKPRMGQSGIQLKTQDGLIDAVTHLINDSKAKTSLVVRGEPRTGKSVFMTVLYFNLLFRFQSGTFDYLPIYVNIEEIERQLDKESPNHSARHTNSYCTKVVTEVKKYLSSGQELATQYGCKACCLLDGLMQHVFYVNADIEKAIKSAIDNDLYPAYSHYIYCIDTDQTINIEYTDVHTDKNASFIAYFDRISTKNVNSSEKFTDFVKAYYRLNGISSETELEQICDNIAKMQLPELDLNILVLFGDKFKTSPPPSFTLILDEYVKELFNTDTSIAAKVSYHLYMQNKGYNAIRQRVKLQSHSKVFEIVRTNKTVAKYLIAINYVHTILDCYDNPNLDLMPLNFLYGNEICKYILSYINNSNYISRICNSEEKIYSKLKPSGKSTLTYIMGRLQLPSETLERIISRQKKELGKPPKHNPKSGDKELYEYYVAKRSISVSEIIGFGKNDNFARAYLKLLLSNGQERRINRNFYLQFYGDREADSVNLTEDTIYEGFDLYQTYHFLASRLKAWKENGKQYPLLSIELFTLCDLIQLRIDNPTVTSKYNSTVPSFFYNEKYRLPKKDMAVNILQLLCEYIDEYTNQYGHSSDYYIFIQYLVHAKVRMTDMLKAQKTDTQEISNLAFVPFSLLQEISALERTKRVGWNISEHIEVLTREDLNAILQGDCCYETVLEHVFEAYLIGLFYLPKESRNNHRYNKQKILNMLLIHDLGEAYIGDCPPMCENYMQSKKDENFYCEKIFLSGLHRDVADIYDYLMLWNAWYREDPDDYNIRIAKEIDKIQLLYKLLVLLSNNRVALVQDRVHEFWDVSNYITTPEGRRVFNLIVAENSTFCEIAKDYGITISKLS